jgi:hypothetical protein
MKRALIALALVSALLAGCKSEPGDELVGKWTGVVQVTDEDVAAAVRTGQATPEVAATAKKLYESLRPTLELRDDRTYSMRMGTEASNGIWEIKDGRITLRLEGVDPEVGYVMSGVPAKDGKTITMNDRNGQQTSTTVFVRDED